MSLLVSMLILLTSVSSSSSISTVSAMCEVWFFLFKLFLVGKSEYLYMIVPFVSVRRRVMGSPPSMGASARLAAHTQ